MAEASKETVTVQEPVYEDRVTLVLTQQEAQVVRDILGSVSGAIGGSRRRLTDSIHGALQPFTENRFSRRDFEGFIRFPETDPETW